MNHELEFAYQVRQVLDEGVDRLDESVAARLRQSRQAALSRLAAPTAELSLAGVGGLFSVNFHQQARGILAAMALLVGAVGTYYWNSFEQAAEHAEIDSALLADEVPFNAYIDQGFQAWLDHVAQADDSDSSQ